MTACARWAIFKDMKLTAALIVVLSILWTISLRMQIQTLNVRVTALETDNRGLLHILDLLQKANEGNVTTLDADTRSLQRILDLLQRANAGKPQPAKQR